MIFDDRNFPSLPASWTTVAVDEAYEAVAIRNKIQAKSYLENGCLAVVDQGASLIGGYSNDLSYTVQTEPPVVVFGDHTRAIKYIDFPFAAGADGIKVLRPCEYFEPRLFYRFLQAIRLPDKGYARHFQHLRTSRIAVPPFNEQKRIADKLDAVLARVDACRERLDRVPAILKRFRQAVLAAATSGTLTEEWRQSRNIEFSWQRCQLTNCFEIFSGFAFKKSQYSSSGSRLLQIANVSYGRTLWKETNYIPEKLAETTFKNFKLRVGDTVMALNRPITNGLLKIAKVSEEDLPATLYQRVACLRLKIESDEQYVFLALRSVDFLHQVEENLQGSDQPYINTSALSFLEINLPSLAEQHEIVGRVETLFAYADRLEARYTTARAQVERLTPALLAKAFRGELVPQDPNDEPASALLERIRASRAAAGEKSTRKARTERKPMATTLTTDTLKEIIRGLPTDQFTFDDLRGQVAADYETLKDMVFALLSEAPASVKQVFDTEAKTMRLVRVKR